MIVDTQIIIYFIMCFVWMGLVIWNLNTVFKGIDYESTGLAIVAGVMTVFCFGGIVYNVYKLIQLLR